MSIVGVIRRELIVPELEAVRKLDVIKELAGHLAECHEGMSQDDIVRVLVERERSGSTAIGEGIAIPHGKLDSVREAVACLGRSRKGVDFESVDGRPTHFVFAVVAPVGSAGGHLKLLARFSRIFQDADFRARLMAAETADDMYRIVAEEDAK